MIKKNTLLFYLIIFIIALSLFQITSCRKKSEITSEKQLEAVVTFISGDAYIISESSILPAAIGGKLEKGDTVKTAADSYLEILLENHAVVRLEGGTELSIDRITAGEEGPDTAFSLLAGSVISKVEKIAGTGGFSVRTSSAAFGVRGTDFLVSSGPQGDLLAVKSGSVKLVPHPGPLDELRLQTGDGGDGIAVFIKSLEEKFPLVEAGNEILFDQQLAREALAPVEKVMSALEEKKSGNIDADALNKAAAGASSVLDAAAAQASLAVAPLSAENAEKLKVTDSMQIHPAGENLKEIIMKTDPPGARIYFDGSFAGFGSVSALLSGERILKINAELEGYLPFETETAVSGISEKPYIIKLEPQPPAKGFVEISVLPRDAQIFVNGSGPLGGTYRGSFDPGARVSVSVKKDEYRQENLEIEIRDGITEKRQVKLEPLLIPYSFPTGLDSALLIAPAGSGQYALSSGEGGLAVISSAGKTLFRSESPVTGKPVFSGGRLFFVSGDSLNAVDGSSWADAGKAALEKSLFRNPVVSGNSVYINSGNSVLRLESASLREERRIRVPDSIVSDPAVSGSTLLTVTDKGVLQVFGESDTPVSSVPVSMGNPAGMSIAISGETAYFAGIRGQLAAVNLKTGSFVWGSTFTPESGGKLPVIFASVKGVAVFSGGALKLFSISGEALGEETGIVSVCAGGENLLYAAAQSGKIAAYDPGTARKAGEADTGLAIRDVFFRDGKIHAALSDGKYAAVNPAAFRR